MLHINRETLSFDMEQDSKGYIAIMSHKLSVYTSGPGDPVLFYIATNESRLLLHNNLVGWCLQGWGELSSRDLFLSNWNFVPCYIATRFLVFYYIATGGSRPVLHSNWRDLVLWHIATWGSCPVLHSNRRDLVLWHIATGGSRLLPHSNRGIQSSAP